MILLGRKPQTTMISNIQYYCTVDRIHKRNRKHKQFPVTHTLKGQDVFVLKYRKAVFSVA